VSALKTRYSAAIEEAIARARASRDLRTVKASDGAEVYAYPHREGIAWGVKTAGSSVTLAIRLPGIVTALLFLRCCYSERALLFLP
jgi:hypothetical protein